MDKDLISIIIPAYNSSLYIAETIDSVLNQSYQTFELLIIDDDSTDNTREIIESYCLKDDRISYYHQKNAGQAAARNKGIKNAKGKYIAFLDSDDIWMKNKLKNQMAQFDLFPQIDLIYTDVNNIDSKNNKTKENPGWISGETSGLTMFISLYNTSGITNSSVLVKTKLFETTGLFDESQVHRGTEDYAMWMKMASLGFVFFGMKEKLVHYRIHEQGTHKNRIKMIYGALATYSKYDTDERIPDKLRLLKYRQYYRELLTEQCKRGASENDFKKALNLLSEQDPKGIITRIQNTLAKLFPQPVVIRFSQLFLYRFLAKLVEA
jgi:teichuronic acid biosynthesis glycosyltransferase TuaG